jgi:hypothetical protein
MVCVCTYVFLLHQESLDMILVNNPSSYDGGVTEFKGKDYAYKPKSIISGVPLPLPPLLAKLDKQSVVPNPHEWPTFEIVSSVNLTIRLPHCVPTEEHEACVSIVQKSGQGVISVQQLCHYRLYKRYGVYFWMSRMMTLLAPPLRLIASCMFCCHKKLCQLLVHPML